MRNLGVNSKRLMLLLLALAIFLIVVVGVLPGVFLDPGFVHAQMSLLQKTEVNAVWISPGSHHYVALDDEGRVWTWAPSATYRNEVGRPYSTRLGDAPITQGGQVTETIYPGVNLPFIVQISSSYRSSYALDRDGNIWSWGNDSGTNGRASLGRPDNNGARPGMVVMPSDPETGRPVQAKWIGAGYYSCKFIDTSGNLWVFGYQMQNSLGTGRSANEPLPVRLEQAEGGSSLLGKNFKMVESSDYFDTACALAITENGELYTWGRTSVASSGYPSNLQSTRPRYIGTYNTTDPIGQPYVAGANNPYPYVNTPLGSEVKNLTCGNGSMGFLTYFGDIYTWGTNSNVEGSGRLGHGHTNAVPLPRKIVNVNNASTPAPKFTSFSIYAWSSSAVGESGVIYGGGANHGGKHGSLGSPNWLTAYTPAFFTQTWRPAMSIVSEGWQGTQWIDVHGNCYSRGDVNSTGPWVEFSGAGVPMFTRLESNPAADQKRYSTNPMTTLEADLNIPAGEVKYVILYPEDTETYIDGERFYDKSFAEFEEPYCFKETDPKLLLSPNYYKWESRYYANPKISEQVFEALWGEKSSGMKGTMAPLGGSSGNSSRFSIQNVVDGNCIIWLQTRNSQGTTRLVFKVDHFYTSTKVWVQGVLSSTASDPAKVLYPPRLVPGTYGLPLTRDGSQLAFASDAEPPLGWDVVQPDPPLNWPFSDYYMLAPENQTAVQDNPDRFGVRHRLDPAKEVMLNDIEMLGDIPSDKTTVTFTYRKNPDRWAHTNLYFVDTHGQRIDVEIDGHPFTAAQQPFLREFMVPLAGVSLHEIDPYIPPVAAADGFSVIGYKMHDFTGLTFEAVQFPQGFNPSFSGKAAGEPLDIYIVYQDTNIYRKPADMKVSFYAVTHAGLPVYVPSQILRGYVGDDVTDLIEDPFAGDPNWRLAEDGELSKLPPNGRFILSDNPDVDYALGEEGYLFYYLDNRDYRWDVSIFIVRDDNPPELHDILKIQSGSDAEIFAPYFEGYVLKSYFIEGEEEVPVDGSFRSMIITAVAASRDVYFNYEWAEGNVIILLKDIDTGRVIDVIGAALAEGEERIYCPGDFDLAEAYYDPVDPDERFVVTGSAMAVTIEIYYRKQTRRVELVLYDRQSGESFATIEAHPQSGGVGFPVGEIAEINAPILPPPYAEEYKLVSPGTVYMMINPGSGSQEVRFDYERIIEIPVFEPATVLLRFLKSSDNALLREQKINGYYAGHVFTDSDTNILKSFIQDKRRYQLAEGGFTPVTLAAGDNVVQAFYDDIGPEISTGSGGGGGGGGSGGPSTARLIIHGTYLLTGQLIYDRTLTTAVGKSEIVAAPLIEGYELDVSSAAKQTVIMKEGDNIVNFIYNRLKSLASEEKEEGVPLGLPLQTTITISEKIRETLATFDHVKYLYGDPDGRVRPDHAITRAEAAMIFWQLLITPDKHIVAPDRFSDVKDGLWYSQAVNYLAKMDILLGFEDGTYRPGQKITRAEFTAMAARVDDLKNDLANPFIDVPGAHWARQVIASAYAQGWISGYPGGEFRPDASITRGEAITIVNRMTGRTPNKETIPEEYHSIYSDLPLAHWAFAAILEASVVHEYTWGDDGSEIWSGR